MKRGTTKRVDVRALRCAVEALERRILLSASFESRDNYRVGAFPIDLVVADFNADGRPDVATADLSGKSLSVRYGNANGTFSSRSIFPVTGFDPNRITAGDVDNDTDIDLIAIDTEGEYTVFLNGPGSGGSRNFTPLATVDTDKPIFEDELVDMNGDGTLDLVIGDLGLFIHLGAGDGTFSATPTPVTIPGGDLIALAIADLDGVGLPDIIAGIAGPSSGVVRQHRVSVINNRFPSGGTTTELDYVPVLPSSIATGDFNEDGKLDFVVVGSSFGASPTQVVRYHQNDGSGGFTTAVTVFNLPASPSGVKTADIDGDGNLDVVVIANNDTLVVIAGNGDGTFATTSTTFATGKGPQELAVADFNGDNQPDVVVLNLSDNNFSIFLNSGTPAPTAPELSASFGKVTLPAVFVPGDKASAEVVIANAGGRATGKVNVELYASTDATLDGADLLLDTGTSLANKSVNIDTDKTGKLTGKFTAPETLANGAYFLIAKVTPVDIDGATEVTAASTTTSEMVRSFGDVGDRTNVEYTLTDADGTKITYGLSGLGTGVVTTVGSDVTITLNGTDTKSKFTATTKAVRATVGSDAETSIANLIVNGPIRSITGKGLQVTGAVSAGDVTTIVLEDVVGTAADVAINLTGTTPVSITLDEVTDASITSTAGLKSLKARHWLDAGFGDDTITAPYLTTLTIADDFAANLLLSGAGAPNEKTLSSAKIGDNLHASIWSAASNNVGTISIGQSVASGWVGNFAGNLKSITTKVNFTGGSLAAANIGTFSVGGDVTGSTVRAGWNFGADNIVDTGDDTDALGIITELSIKNSLASSTFWAGVDELGTPVAGSAIKLIGTIKTVAPTGVEFLAASFPRTVRFDGETLNTIDDPRFDDGVL